MKKRQQVTAYTMAYVPLLFLFTAQIGLVTARGQEETHQLRVDKKSTVTGTCKETSKMIFNSKQKTPEGVWRVEIDYQGAMAFRFKKGEHEVLKHNASIDGSMGNRSDGFGSPGSWAPVHYPEADERKQKKIFNGEAYFRATREGKTYNPILYIPRNQVKDYFASSYLNKFLPPKKVKEGDSWEIRPIKARSLMKGWKMDWEVELPHQSGSATARFNQTYMVMEMSGGKKVKQTYKNKLTGRLTSVTEEKKEGETIKKGVVEVSGKLIRRYRSGKPSQGANIRKDKFELTGEIVINLNENLPMQFQVKANGRSDHRDSAGSKMESQDKVNWRTVFQRQYKYGEEDGKDSGD